MVWRVKNRYKCSLCARICGICQYFSGRAAGTIRSMKKILLVRLSSMGDVIHNLPAVTDLARAMPDAQIDWLVDEAFQEIPRLHPAIKRVIPLALRRWKKTPLKSLFGSELRQFRAAMREAEYDLILDSQGLLKSAVFASMARGPLAGYDRQSARESIASLFYRQHFNNPTALHAIDRNRRLSAQALAYPLAGHVDYGLPAPAVSLPWLPQQSYVTLLTATSRTDKEWPEAHWQEIGRRFAAESVACILPWGNAIERARSERLAALIPNAICPPRMSLTEAAALLASSKIVVGVDTGLAHLAAALATPVVAIFCASDPHKTGVRADTFAVNLGEHGAAPDVESVWQAILQGRKA